MFALKVDFYLRKKVKVVTDVVKRFYTNWSDDVYNDYLNKFKIDSDKRLNELSKGMQMKYSLTQYSILATGVIIFLFSGLFSYAISIKRFEKVDI